MANPFLVLGGIAVGIVTAGFGILQVPGWIGSAQDAAAINDLDNVKSLQSAASSLIGGYQSTAELTSHADQIGGKMTTSGGVTLCVSRSTDRSAYAAVAKSGSGAYYAQVNGGKYVRGATITAALAAAGGLPAGVAAPMDDKGCTPGAEMGAGGAEGGSGSGGTADAPGIITFTLRCDEAEWFDVPLAGHIESTDVKWSDGYVADVSPNRELVAGVTYTVTYPAESSSHGNWSRGRECIRSVDKWTTQGNVPVDGTDMFSAMPNLTTVPKSAPPLLSTVGMFANSRQFNSDISGWDVSRATSMNRMFMDTSSFNQPLSAWKTSNVTNMDNMFDGAEAFNQDLSGWDVSKVTARTDFAPTIQASYLPKFR